MATVLLCDAPSVRREVLLARLCALPQISSAAACDDPDALLAQLVVIVPDLVLLPSDLPGGHAAATVSAVLERTPETAVLVLTLGTDPEAVAACVDAGASGYLAKDAAVPELAAALAQLPAGPPTEAPAVDQASQHLLTERELQVLQGMSRGRSNSQIGSDLFLSEDTIKTHARRLFRKMSAKDRAHAVAEGIRRGLLH
jgi:DNA-binding NarL/FixJ family response regulator